MSKAKKRIRGKFLGRRHQKPVDPEVSEGRAIDPARYFQDWIEWLQIVRPGTYPGKSLKSV